MNDALLSLLKNARQSSGLKQSDVALQLGLKGNTISNWEKGRSEPDIETFVKLCSIYKVNPNELLEKSYASYLTSDEFTIEEKECIKKYRTLDQRGKNNVQNTLNHEYNLQKVHYDIKEERLLMMSDKDIDEQVENYRLELVAERGSNQSHKIQTKKA